MNEHENQRLEGKNDIKKRLPNKGVNVLGVSGETPERQKERIQAFFDLMERAVERIENLFQKLKHKEMLSEESSEEEKKQVKQKDDFLFRFIKKINEYMQKKLQQIMLENEKFIDAIRAERSRIEEFLKKLEELIQQMSWLLIIKRQELDVALQRTASLIADSNESVTVILQDGTEVNFEFSDIAHTVMQMNGRIGNGEIAGRHVEKTYSDISDRYVQYKIDELQPAKQNEKYNRTVKDSFATMVKEKFIEPSRGLLNRVVGCENALEEFIQRKSGCEHKFGINRYDVDLNGVKHGGKQIEIIPIRLVVKGVPNDRYSPLPPEARDNWLSGLSSAGQTLFALKKHKENGKSDSTRYMPDHDAPSVGRIEGKADPSNSHSFTGGTRPAVRNPDERKHETKNEAEQRLAESAETNTPDKTAGDVVKASTKVTSEVQPEKHPASQSSASPSVDVESNTVTSVVTLAPVPNKEGEEKTQSDDIGKTVPQPSSQPSASAKKHEPKPVTQLSKLELIAQRKAQAEARKKESAKIVKSPAPPVSKENIEPANAKEQDRSKEEEQNLKEQPNPLGGPTANVTPKPGK